MLLEQFRVAGAIWRFYGLGVLARGFNSRSEIVVLGSDEQGWEKAARRVLEDFIVLLLVQRYLSALLFAYRFAACSNSRRWYAVFSGMRSAYPSAQRIMPLGSAIFQVKARRLSRIDRKRAYIEL